MLSKPKNDSCQSFLGLVRVAVFKKTKGNTSWLMESREALKLNIVNTAAPSISYDQGDK